MQFHADRSGRLRPRFEHTTSLELITCIAYDNIDLRTRLRICLQNTICHISLSCHVSLARR